MKCLDKKKLNLSKEQNFPRLTMIKYKIRMKPNKLKMKLKMKPNKLKMKLKTRTQIGLRKFSCWFPKPSLQSSFRPGPEILS